MGDAVNVGRRNLRVILASGYPRGRRFIRTMVEDEAGAVVIGQAENTPGTIALARSLRPDVVIIDSRLPHTMALESVPLTQIGGLDAAQAAIQEIPNARVVLLNTDTIPREGVMSADYVPLFSRENGGDSTPFTLQQLVSDPAASRGLVFASIQIAPSRTLKNKILAFGDKAILGGILAILLGLIFIVTQLAAAGFVTVIVGTVSLLVGAIIRLGSFFWFRSSGSQ